jgi:hypothetical protein
MVDLGHQAFFILVRSSNRTDACAGGIITMEAGPGNIGYPDIRVLTFYFLNDIHPEKCPAFLGLFCTNIGNIVF